METGDKIPEVLGLDQAGNEVRSSDFEGKALIIYFYPKDNTPGCTAEACSLRDFNSELEAKGYTSIGISKDSVASHAKFADKYSLPFILLSDPTTEVNQSFGVWQKKKMAGREYMGIVRTTFVCDNDGTITDVVAKVNTKGAAEQLFALLDGRGAVNPAP